MAQDSQWTVLRLLEWTTGFLRERGSRSPRLDAEVLLAHCRGTSRIELYTAFEEIAADALRDRFRELVRRRAEGCPVAYLIGSREFFSRPFQVTPDVLIPRPETEFVITALLDRVRVAEGPQASLHLADIGTGSGILVVTSCLELPSARGVAIDISDRALAIAKRNAEDHRVAERIRFIVSDLLEAVPPSMQFDAIVSNPPYVSDAEFQSLPTDVREYEPSVALLAGPRGTAVIERLIPQSFDRLKIGGWLIFEISPMIEPAARQLLAAQTGFDSIETVRDLAGLTRVIAARKWHREGEVPKAK